MIDSINAMQSMFGSKNVKYDPESGIVQVYGVIPGTNFIKWYIYGKMTDNGLIAKSPRVAYLTN